MGRIGRGHRLVKASWEVLKADKELLLLPLLSFGAIILVSLPFIGAAVGTDGFPQSGEMSSLQWVLMGIFFFLSYFIGIFFNAAIVGAATIRLQGGNPTVKDGLDLAWSKVGKIFAWACIAASVGLILRAVEDKLGFLGRIVIAIIGAAWSAVTFFVVPVLLFEEVSAGESVKRSATIFKARWGEQFVGNISIGLALLLIALPLVFFSILLIGTIPFIGVPLLVLTICALIAVGNAMTGIFNAALYRYAVTGESSEFFAEEDLQGAFRPKKKRGLIG